MDSYGSFYDSHTAHFLLLKGIFSVIVSKLKQSNMGILAKLLTSFYGNFYGKKDLKLFSEK